MVEKLRNACCCPSFLLAICGPYISILGAVFLENAVIQPLTDYVWLGGDPNYSNRIEFTAKLFRALNKALKNLETFYRNDVKKISSSDQRYFPHPRSYPTNDGIETNFAYLHHLTDYQPTKAIFKAKTQHGKVIVVKFVERYNAAAHRLLAEQDYAPELIYDGTSSGQTYGGMSMVVMDFVEGKTLYDLFETSPISSEIHTHIANAMDVLHSQNIVFGDLRKANIILRGQRPILIDFDWAGLDGIAKYPATLNDGSSIGWHAGVERGGLMGKDHDIHMLRALLE